MLFDATGTLIELREPVGETYARIAHRHGVSLPAWRLEDGFRRILGGKAARVFPAATPAEVPERERAWWQEVVRDSFRASDQTLRFDDFESFFDELFQHYASRSAWQLRAGAREALAALSAQGTRLGIVSDFDYRLTELLESLGIASFFETVILAGSLAVTKPDPRLFRAALEALEAPASHCVYVGDDPERDLAGALQAGLRAIDVRSLTTLADLPAHLATLAAPDSTDTSRDHTENR